MKHPLQLTWDLESIFNGGSSSETFASFLKNLEQDMNDLQNQVTNAKAPQTLEETLQLDATIDLFQSSGERLSEASSFVACLTSQDQKDKKAIQLSGKIATLAAKLNSVSTLFQNVLRETDEQVWAAWMQRSEIAPISFSLNESRDIAREKMSPELERLALDLAVDGYHGWGELYETIVSQVRIPFEENGETVLLSAGQAANKLVDPDRNVREKMLTLWEKAWSEAADYCVDTLNHIAGFRNKLYEKRGWDDTLKEPLAINRMTRQTLDSMWKVITDNKPVFASFLERKAKLLGVEKLSWADVDAPIGQSTGKINYNDAADEIVEQFHKFSPKLADFAVHAFENNWIEVEDRPGKRPGGFCTSLPVSKQTRIFMTFGGTASNVSTLAHELGHGYHQYVMDDLPHFNQDYAMNVAETASTFAEMIVADSLVKGSTDEQEKLALLENKIGNSISMFMNIHARFLFETRFYEKRKNGLVSAEELSELMEEAQKEAFCGKLASYHPHFWASKLHFYITDVPFYNFPYTFGYLFSTGIYARAQQEGPAFADKYDALLRDTGRMTVEDLAQKHLGVELTGSDFWQSAIQLCLDDVEQFLKMTDHLV